MSSVADATLAFGLDLGPEDNLYEWPRYKGYQLQYSTRGGLDFDQYLAAHDLDITGLEVVYYNHYEFPAVFIAVKKTVQSTLDWEAKPVKMTEIFDGLAESADYMEKLAEIYKWLYEIPAEYAEKPIPVFDWFLLPSYG